MSFPVPFFFTTHRTCSWLYLQIQKHPCVKRLASSFSPGCWPFSSCFIGSLHDFLFAPDCISLESSAKNDAAGDDSWHFGVAGRSQNLILAYNNPNRNDARDAFFLLVDPRARIPALKLFFEELGTFDALFICLAILATGIAVLIAWCLTASLTSHIFLLKLLRKYRLIPYRHRPAQDQLKCPELQKPGEPLASLDCKQYVLKYAVRTSSDIIQDGKLILQTQVELERLYDTIWKQIPKEEKYILYDFAMDGFTNYKAGALIYKLMYRGPGCSSSSPRKPCTRKFSDSLPRCPS
jgi:hypothetical protein